MMNAVVLEKYGPPNSLKLKKVKKPTPKKNEVLIKIYASSVTMGDCELRSFKFPWFIWIPLRLYLGIRKPRNTILGQEISGVVEEIGENVRKFAVGDSVFASTGFKFGGYAEFITLSENSHDGVIEKKPSNLTYEEAAIIPVGGLNALHFISKAKIKQGQHILINGAGGSIGTIAVQLAKNAGAEITAVDKLEKFEMLESIGASHLIDYNQEDFTKNEKKYDIIFDIIGKSSFSRCLKSLNQNGYLLIGNPKISSMIRGFWKSKTSEKNVITSVASYNVEALSNLNKLIENGSLKPILDRTFLLDEIQEAHNYVDSGSKKGNVAIKIR